MKLLLDTQCWLWWFTQPERVNEKAIAQIADEANELCLSVIITCNTNSLK